MRDALVGISQRVYLDVVRHSPNSSAVLRFSGYLNIGVCLTAILFKPFLQTVKI